MKAQAKLEKGVYSVDQIAHIHNNTGDDEWLANVVFLDSSTLFEIHQGKPEFKYDKTQIKKMFELQRLSALKAQDRTATLDKQLDSVEGLSSKLEDSDSSLWITIDATGEDSATQAYTIARSLQEVGLGNRYDQIVYGPKAFVNCHKLKTNLSLESEPEDLSRESEEKQGTVAQDVFEEDAPFGNPMQKQGEVSKDVIEGASSTKHKQVQACVTENVFGGDGSHTKPREERADLPGNVFGEAVPLKKIRVDESGEGELGFTTNAEGSSQPVADDFGDNLSSDDGSDSGEYDESASMTKEDGDLHEMIPLKEWSRDLRLWLFTAAYVSTLLDVYLRKKDYVHRYPSFVQRFNTTFLNVFGFNGFDPVNLMIYSADGNKTRYKGSKLPFWLMLASFLGLPSRAESVVDGVPQFSGWQLLRNLFGVWIPFKETLSSQNGLLSFYQYRSTEKKVVQSLLLLFKLVLIFPIKLILMPFKILLNIIKLVTEVFLPLISEYTAMLNGALIVGLKDFCDEQIANGFLRAGLIFLGMIPLVAMVIIQYAMVWVNRLAFAFTSPEMSARAAFALGYTLTIGKKGSPLQRSISTIMGGLGAIVSLALSGVLWAFALPLAISALVTAIPSLLTAVTWISQLPIVTTSLAWLGQWPLLTNLTVLLKSAISTVGGGLALAFGPYITPLATAIGFQISAAVMTVGTFLGMIAIPVAAILSRAADELSNVWARWVEQKPFARFGRWASGNNGDESTKKVSMPSENKVFVYQALPGGDYIVSSRALNLRNLFDEELKAIEVAGYKAEALFLRAKENKEYDSNEQARFPTAAEQLATAEYPVLAK